MRTLLANGYRLVKGERAMKSEAGTTVDGYLHLYIYKFAHLLANPVYFRLSHLLSIYQ
jgi:hypothetical protein